MIGSAALGIWFDLHSGDREDFEGWYRRQHLPERLGVPGFMRGRRYRAAGGGHPEFFTLYETRDGDVLSSAPYLERLNDPTPWTRRALPRMARMVRNGYRLLATGPDVLGARLLTVRILPHAGRGPAVRDALAKEAVGAVRQLGGVAGCAVYETLPAAGSIVTEERKIVGGEVTSAPPYLALCEHEDEAAAGVLDAFWRAWARAQAADVTVDVFRLLYGLGWIEGPGGATA
ncbi:MAG TPA: hypothetical protein VNN07_14715 [Candidatus Tectomicrobia bacterium]|nr:hypothetical protein [Candidatus Tectomicrobia bacterium]